MSIEYGTIIQIRFQSKEESLFFVEKVSEEEFTLLSKDGDKVVLPFEGSDILDVSIVYQPEKHDYASIRNLYVGNWVKVNFQDGSVYGKLVKTGRFLEIESDETYYIPVKYGLPPDVLSIEVTVPPLEKKVKQEEAIVVEEEAELFDQEDDYDQLFYTMEQKKSDLTDTLLQQLSKQSQTALKKVYNQVQRFQELFEKYTSFDRNILLKRLPENLATDSFLKNTNPFYMPVSSHIKVKQRDFDGTGFFPSYYFQYREPDEIYDMYKNETIRQIPYQDFLYNEARVVQSYDIKKNHTEKEMYPTKEREVYLLKEFARYKVNESFVTDSFLYHPVRPVLKTSTLLKRVNQSRVPSFDMFFRHTLDDVHTVVVNESYTPVAKEENQLIWYKNECATFKEYVEKLVPSFHSFMEQSIDSDFVNMHQALQELDKLQIDEMNADVYGEISEKIKKNVSAFTADRERSKKQNLRKKPLPFNKDLSELHSILQKEYSLGKPAEVYYSTSELWKEGMFDYFHYYTIQYLKKHMSLKQPVSDQEMAQLVQEIKQAYGKETDEKIHKNYKKEQQRENDQYKMVLQDIPKGTTWIPASEELHFKLRSEKGSTLSLDDVTIKLNRIKDLGENEIPEQFDKTMEPYVREFLLKHKIMKGQVAFVQESGKKYRWTGEKWGDLTEDIQKKKLFKIKDFKYDEEIFKKKVQEMIHEFESDKLRAQALEKMNLDSESHKITLARAKSMKIKESMKYHNEKHHYYELEMQKELFETTPSPYLSLRNRILQEPIMENKYKAIQLFVQQYTKTGEDVHWYYCLETSSKLIPCFFMELADAFLKTNTYPETLQLICDRQGELSDNNDFFVDKYSGFPIKPIQFDEEEDYNDQGFKDIFHSAVEKENVEIHIDTQNPVRNALKAFLSLMGILPEPDVIEDVLTLVEKSFTLASGDKKKPREQNQIYIFAILAHSLIYAQTLEGKVRLSKPFPDCPKSLKGYPLNQTSKKGLEFVCCVVLKIPKVNEPWASMSQIKLDKLMEMSEVFIEKYVLTIQDVRERLDNHRIVQEKKEEYPEWKLFYPRLKPIQVVLEESSHPEDRILALSLLIQQKIHAHVSTQMAVLVNQAQEPYLINSCCQTNNNVYEYMIEHAKIDATLRELYVLIKKENKSKLSLQHMYNTEYTKTPSSIIPSSFDEKTIYRAVIKIFLFDSTLNIPEKLKKYKIVKPDAYKKNDPFVKKLELLKQTPITEEMFVSILRDNAKVFEPRKGRVLVEEEVGDQPIDLMIKEKKEKDLYDFCMVAIEDKMKEILAKVRERTDKKRFQQCLQFYTLFRDQKQNDFLPEGVEHQHTLGQLLYNKIVNLLYVFPEKIKNKKYFKKQLPRHWNLDEKHVENILEFTEQYYSNLTNFYEDESWENKQEKIDTSEYMRWIKMEMSIPMRLTLYSYIYVSLFHNYVKEGMMDYVKTVVGIFLEEDKLALNFDKKQIDFLSDMAKKSETEIKTEKLKQLTKDARKAQNAMKELKLGEWGVGLDKSIFKYDKSKYGDVLDEATQILKGMDVPDEIYGTYGLDDGDNLEGFDGDEYYS